MTRPVVLVAGGTGGHAFPAIAVGRILEDAGTRVLYVTDPRAAPYYKNVDQARLVTLSIQTSNLVLKLLTLLWAMFESLSLFLKDRPACVVGFGGYPAAPSLCAAAILGIPIVIHEQNAILGRVNYFFANIARTVALSFPVAATLPRSILTGIPVRPQIEALQARTYMPPAPTCRLLVMGGSQGASVFDTLVPQAIALLPDDIQACFEIHQQCRATSEPAVRQAYARTKAVVTLQPFFEDVPALLERAHLVISRAGASSVAELAVAGVPSILFPLPSAKDDHQTANARVLSDAAAAILFDEKTTTSMDLARTFRDLLDTPSKLLHMSAHTKKITFQESGKKLAQTILECATK